MPTKRQVPKACDKPSVDVAADELPTIPENCSNIAEALRSASSLPEACRMMLIASLEHLFAGKRDDIKGIVAGLIGEVLAQRRNELATRAECFEQDVSASKATADENAEVVRKAEDLVAQEASVVSAKQAVFDEDDGELKQAKDTVEKVEGARSAYEASLLAAELEKEQCQSGRKLVNAGAESDEIKTEELTKRITGIQHLATKLGLEQSLVLTLQFMAKKPMSEWTNFEKQGARMIDETLAKHLVELETKLEGGQACMDKHIADVEAARTKFDAAKERCSTSEASLREAQSKHNEIESQAKELKRISKESAAVLEQAQEKLSEAQSELSAFCKGPMETFLTLNGSPAVELSAPAEPSVVGSKPLEPEPEPEEPSAKKLRLSADEETDLTA